MEAADELLTISELAIALAGFSGVVAAFDHRNGIASSQRFYFISLVTVALSTVILAFVPFLLHSGGVIGSAIWKNASAAMIVIALYEAIHLSIIAPPSEEGKLGFVAEIVARSLPIIIVSTQILNYIAWPLPSGALLYIVGLLLWLILSGLTFVYMVVYGSTPDD